MLLVKENGKVIENANKEMKDLLVGDDSFEKMSVKTKLSEYYEADRYDERQVAGAASLLDYLKQKTLTNQLTEKEVIFKRKHPTKYIQVKVRMIKEGNETNLLAICTDISQIKRFEKQ